VDCVEQIAYLNPSPEATAAARWRYYFDGLDLSGLPDALVEAEARAGLLLAVVALAELRRRNC
jgi:hypothetical protein